MAWAPDPVPEVTHTLEAGQDRARARILIRVSGMTKSWVLVPWQGSAVRAAVPMRVTASSQSVEVRKDCRELRQGGRDPGPVASNL